MGELNFYLKIIKDKVGVLKGFTYVEFVFRNAVLGMGPYFMKVKCRVRNCSPHILLTLS